MPENFPHTQDQVVEQQAQAQAIERSRVRQAVGKTALAVGLMASSLVGVGGGEAAAAHEPSHASIASTVEAPPAATAGTTKVTETFTIGDSEVYAPNFTASPQAGELTDASSPAVNAESIASQIQGDVVESISVQGSASAEDAGPNSGVTTPSEQNIELAADRATVFEPQLEAALIQAGVSIPEIQTATPIEDSWSPEEVTQATDFASQFGYQDYSQMIQSYNDDPSKVPLDVENFLNQTLQSHRDVKVVVVVDKQQQAHAISIPRHENVNDKQQPGPGRHEDRTTINTLAGYIPEDAYAAGTTTPTFIPNRASRRSPTGTTLPPTGTNPPVFNPPSGSHDRHSRVNSLQISRNERPVAIKHKQPLPGNYNPNSSRSAGNKNHTLGRTGRG